MAVQYIHANRNNPIVPAGVVSLYKSRFIDRLNSLAPLREETISEILKIISFKKFRKNECVLRTGKMSKNIYFICKGAVSIYYLYGEGKKYNKNLLFENDFPAAASSYLQNIPSNLTIETLEDSILICWNYDKLKQLMSKYEDLKDAYIAYLERSWIVEKEKRELSFATESADKRYLDLLKKYPNIEERIPLHHIASHLGITPTQLSRIRKDLKQDSQHI